MQKNVKKDYFNSPPFVGSIMTNPDEGGVDGAP